MVLFSYVLQCTVSVCAVTELVTGHIDPVSKRKYTSTTSNKQYLLNMMVTLFNYFEMWSFYRAECSIEAFVRKNEYLQRYDMFVAK